jgi:hypothetical protein
MPMSAKAAGLVAARTSAAVVARTSVEASRGRAASVCSRTVSPPVASHVPACIWKRRSRRDRPRACAGSRRDFPEHPGRAGRGRWARGARRSSSPAAKALGGVDVDCRGRSPPRGSLRAQRDRSGGGWQQPGQGREAEERTKRDSVWSVIGSPGRVGREFDGRPAFAPGAVGFPA